MLIPFFLFSLIPLPFFPIFILFKFFPPIFCPSRASASYHISDSRSWAQITSQICQNPITFHSLSLPNAHSFFPSSLGYDIFGHPPNILAKYRICLVPSPISPIIYSITSLTSRHILHHLGWSIPFPPSFHSIPIPSRIPFLANARQSASSHRFAARQSPLPLNAQFRWARPCLALMPTLPSLHSSLQGW